MRQTKKLTALFQLIDDPDPQVYDVVVEEICQLGPQVITNLETFWEHQDNEDVQKRVESIIHRINFKKIQTEFSLWLADDQPSLFKGALILAKYIYPNLKEQSALNAFENIRKNIWLELNNYLTPLEQFNIFSSVFFNYYKMHGIDLKEKKIDHFLVHQVMTTGRGNCYSLGLLILALSELLDLPIFALDIPRQFVLCYVDSNHSFFSVEPLSPKNQILFFIDPNNGMIYTKNDLSNYLKTIGTPETDQIYTPLSKHTVMYKYILGLKKTFEKNNKLTEVDDLNELLQMMDQMEFE